MVYTEQGIRFLFPRFYSRVHFQTVNPSPFTTNRLMYVCLCMCNMCVGLSLQTMCMYGEFVGKNVCVSVRLSLFPRERESIQRVTLSTTIVVSRNLLSFKCKI